MNVLVTGAAGFLGSHLMLHHLKLGHNVVGVDNFCSSDPGSKHLDHIKSHPNASFFVCDISHTGDTSLKHLVNKNHPKTKFDLIYNFACPASPPIYQAMPIHTMLTCTVGTASVLQIALEHGSRVVHASTSEVYGDPEHSPQAEDYRGCVNPYGPRSCYDEGKRSAEALCYDYLNTHKVDARLVRIFNTYGPNMDPHDGRVVSNMICQALRGQDLTVYGDGTQTRSFCYVDDLIRGIVSLGQLDHNPQTPINVGNPGEFTIKRLAELVKSVVPTAGEIVYKSLPKDDPLQRRPHLGLAKKIINWEPTINLEDGLVRTVEYFRSELTRRGVI